MTSPSAGAHPPEAETGPHAASPVPGGDTTPAAAERPAGPAADELASLRAEVEMLRAQVDTQRRRAGLLVALRRATAAVLAALTAFAVVASVVGLWAANTTLNTDRWVATVAPLPKDPEVAAAVAQFTTQRVFEVVDVEQRIRAVLPQQAAFVAGPLTTQLRDVVQKTVDNVLQNERFQQIWSEINRRAHERALAIINGTSSVVAAREDRVDIDLLPLFNQVLRQLSDSLPTLFGRQLSLPDLTSGEIPADLRIRVQDALGVTLPANFAQFTLYDAGRLRAAQRAVVTAKRDLALLVVGTVLLLLLAFVVSPRRRRTALQLGVWLVVAAAAVTAVVRAVRGQLLEQIPAGTYRDGAAAAVTIVFAQLRARGLQLIWAGAILAVLMYLIGPGRFPIWLRRHLAIGARVAGRWVRDGSRVLAARGPGWIASHLDAVRVAGVVVAVVLALILSSWTALLVITLVLTAFEIAVTVLARAVTRQAQVAPAAPPAQPGRA